MCAKTSGMRWLIVASLLLVTASVRLENSMEASDAEALRFPMKRWAQVLPTLKTGDLVISATGTLGAGIIRAFTGDFSHVGMVVVMCQTGPNEVWQVRPRMPAKKDIISKDFQGSRDGVKCKRFVAELNRQNHQNLDWVIFDEEGIKLTPCHYHVFRAKRTRVVIRRVRHELSVATAHKLARILSCLRAVKTRYVHGRQSFSMVKSAGIPLYNRHWSWHQMFCSEFMAYVSFELGLMKWKTEGDAWISSESLKLPNNWVPTDFTRDDTLWKAIDMSGWVPSSEVFELDLSSGPAMLVSNEMYRHFMEKKKRQEALRVHLEKISDLETCEPEALTWLQDHFPEQSKKLATEVEAAFSQFELWTDFAVLPGNGFSKWWRGKITLAGLCGDRFRARTPPLRLFYVDESNGYLGLQEQGFYEVAKIWKQSLRPQICSKQSSEAKCLRLPVIGSGVGLKPIRRVKPRHLTVRLACEEEAQAFSRAVQAWLTLSPGTPMDKDACVDLFINVASASLPSAGSRH